MGTTSFSPTMHQCFNLLQNVNNLLITSDCFMINAEAVQAKVIWLRNCVC